MTLGFSRKVEKFLIHQDTREIHDRNNVTQTSTSHHIYTYNTERYKLPLPPFGLTDSTDESSTS